MTILSNVVGGTHPVLHNCWLEGSGADAFGRDSIEALVQTLDLRDPPHDLQSSGSALLVGQRGDALFADIIGGEVKRLWMIAQGEPRARACDRTDVPFDTDLDQRGGTLAFDPADHPDLAPEHAERVRKAGSNWLKASGEQSLRSLRPFVLRAFSDGDTAAALVAVYGLRGDAIGQLRFNIAIVVPPSGEDVEMVDRGGLEDAFERVWSPGL